MGKKKQYIGGKIAVTEQDKNTYFRLNQEFTGISLDEETMFPKGLGAKHPFEFSDLEKLYIKYGIVAETVNKMANSIVTDFEIKLKNPNAQAIIDDFIHDTNFHTVVDAWTREGLLKGNGFIELDLKNSRIRILNANNMYVKRNIKGKVLSYNQWTKPFKNFNRDSPDLINFKPEQIAHLPINKIPNDPYGIGIIYPNERIIENLVKNEQDLQLITTRKAGMPYHIKVGQPGINVPQAVVDDVKSKLQYLRNTHEWVTDGNVEIKAIEFRGLTGNLTETQLYFFKQFIAGVGIPEVLFGSGQLNEGIAKTQMEAFKRKIAGYQTQIKQVIEEKIIRPLLRAHDLDEVPNFIWELPTEEDIDKRLAIITEDLKNPLLSSMMRAALEIEKAKLMGFEDLANVLPTPEEAQTQDLLDKERQQEEAIPQPEVPGAKPRANQSTDEEVHIEENTNITEEVMNDMTIKEFVNIKEIRGFNYTDYLVKILEAINKDDFTTLKAITESDELNGLLPDKEIEKLRTILKDGFRKNQTIRQIENEISSNIALTDRITATSVISAEFRANTIARTETVRLANEGLIDLYKENKIEKVRFLAAVSPRTCVICLGLNGTVYNINESSGIIPVHPDCRCSWISIIE